MPPGWKRQKPLQTRQHWHLQSFCVSWWLWCVISQFKEKNCLVIHPCPGGHEGVTCFEEKQRRWEWKLVRMCMFVPVGSRPWVHELPGWGVEPLLEGTALHAKCCRRQGTAAWWERVPPRVGERFGMRLTCTIEGKDFKKQVYVFGPIWSACTDMGSCPKLHTENTFLKRGEEIMR